MRISKVTVSKANGAAVGNVPGGGTLFSDCARDIGSIDNRRSAHAEHDIITINAPFIAYGELISSNHNKRPFLFSGKDSRYSINAIIGDQGNGVTSLRDISCCQRECKRCIAQVKRPGFIKYGGASASQGKGHGIVAVQRDTSKQIDLPCTCVGNPEMIIACRVYEDFLSCRKCRRDGNFSRTGGMNFTAGNNTGDTYNARTHTDIFKRHFAREAADCCRTGCKRVTGK